MGLVVDLSKLMAPTRRSPPPFAPAPADVPLAPRLSKLADTCLPLSVRPGGSLLSLNCCLFDWPSSADLAKTAAGSPAPLNWRVAIGVALVGVVGVVSALFIDTSGSFELVIDERAAALMLARAVPLPPPPNLINRWLCLDTRDLSVGPECNCRLIDRWVPSDGSAGGAKVGAAGNEAELAEWPLELLTNCLNIVSVSRSFFSCSRNCC